jgi:hypothetical protein
MDDQLDQFAEYAEEQAFPAVSEALIERLDSLYPAACPVMTDPDRLIWIKAGQRAVVDFLRSRFDEQQTQR